MSYYLPSHITNNRQGFAKSWTKNYIAIYQITTTTHDPRKHPPYQFGCVVALSLVTDQLGTNQTKPAAITHPRGPCGCSSPLSLLPHFNSPAFMTRARSLARLESRYWYQADHANVTHKSSINIPKLILLLSVFLTD